MDGAHQNRRGQNYPSVSTGFLMNSDNEGSNDIIKSTVLAAYALADSLAIIQKALHMCTCHGKLTKS